MYCDYCGNKLSSNARYCRLCGRQLSGRLGDTQPLPVIDQVMLENYKNKSSAPMPWYKMIFKKIVPGNRSKVWNVMYSILSLAIIVGVLYILATFKTVKEYQTLTVVLGSIVLLYIWWKR